MKRVNRFIISLALLISFSSNAFAIMNTGYIWIQTGIWRAWDAINYGNLEQKYVLKSAKNLPDVNSTIRIEAKNRFYFDFSLVQDIATNFISLLKEGKCEDIGGI